MKRFYIFMLVAMMVFMASACGKSDNSSDGVSGTGSAVQSSETSSVKQTEDADVPDGFVKIPGGTFQMGSPETEDWRSENETVHMVTVSDFYMETYEVTQTEYQEVIGNNPSDFTGDNFLVENLTWYEAVAYCNACSEKEGLAKVYTVDGKNVTWNRSADGYRLLAEVEWEYSCRAGTETPNVHHPEGIQLFCTLSV